MHKIRVNLKKSSYIQFISCEISRKSIIIIDDTSYEGPCEGECSETFIGIFFCDKLDLNAYCPNEGSCCISSDADTTQAPDRRTNSEESEIRTNKKMETRFLS